MDPLTLGVVAATAVGSVLSGSVSTALRQRFLRGRGKHATAVEQQVQETLEGRLAELGSTLDSASKLMVLVETELQARQKQAADLAAQVEKQQHLASLTKDQQDAIASLLRQEVVAGNKKINLSAFWMGAGFFAAGSGVSWIIQILAG